MSSKSRRTPKPVAPITTMFDAWWTLSNRGTLYTRKSYEEPVRRGPVSKIVWVAHCAATKNQDHYSDTGFKITYETYSEEALDESVETNLEPEVKEETIWLLEELFEGQLSDRFEEDFVLRTCTPRINEELDKIAPINQASRKKAKGAWLKTWWKNKMSDPLEDSNVMVSTGNRPGTSGTAIGTSAPSVFGSSGPPPISPIPPPSGNSNPPVSIPAHLQAPDQPRPNKSRKGHPAVQHPTQRKYLIFEFMCISTCYMCFICCIQRFPAMPVSVRLPRALQLHIRR